MWAQPLLLVCCEMVSRRDGEKRGVPVSDVRARYRWELWYRLFIGNTARTKVKVSSEGNHRFSTENFDCDNTII